MFIHCRALAARSPLTRRPSLFSVTRIDRSPLHRPRIHACLSRLTNASTLRAFHYTCKSVSISRESTIYPDSRLITPAHTSWESLFKWLTRYAGFAAPLIIFRNPWPRITRPSHCIQPIFVKMYFFPTTKRVNCPPAVEAEVTSVRLTKCFGESCFRSPNTFADLLAIWMVPTERYRFTSC